MLIASQYQLLGAISAINTGQPNTGIQFAPSAIPLHPRCKVGVSVEVYAPGWPMFDGVNGTRVVTFVNPTSGLILVAADTTGQVDTTIRPNSQVNLRN